MMSLRCFSCTIRRIRDLREDSDLTQTQIAQAINITQRSYSYYETGTHMIPPWVLSALADFQPYQRGTISSAAPTCAPRIPRRSR